jgi:hypothetical protein
MDVSRRGFAPKRQIRCQENLFWREDLIYFSVQIGQIRARGSPVARLLGALDCVLSTHTRVVAIQRHDFRVPALNLRLLFHTSIPPLCASELTPQPSSRSFPFPP